MLEGVLPKLQSAQLSLLETLIPPHLGTLPHSDDALETPGIAKLGIGENHVVLDHILIFLSSPDSFSELVI